MRIENELALVRAAISAQTVQRGHNLGVDLSGLSNQRR